jgi:vancomycin resistance protein YoaR
VSEQPNRPSDSRVVPWLLLAVALLVGGLLGAAHLLTAQRIPLGTTVNGTPVGGLRPRDAEARLTLDLTGRAARPITVGAEGEQMSVRPASAGFAVDVPATVALARPAASWDLHRTWDWFAGGTRVEAVVSVDRTALDRTVAALARRVDDPAVEGAVTFADGRVEARYPQRGTLLDREAAAAAVERAFLHDGGAGRVVELRSRVDRPRVAADEVSATMERFANPAVSGPVVVRFRGRQVRLDPSDYTRALSVRAVSGRLEPHVDRAALLEVLGPDLDRSTREPRDAAVSVVAGRPRVVAGRVGTTYDPEEVTRGFARVLATTGPDRVLEVRSVAVPPAFGTADARRMRVTERVSAFTTRFPYASYRNRNLGRAADLVDGMLLQPGRTFSLNRRVGERTPAHGFTTGYVVTDGLLTADPDGGVSQVATTLYNAAFLAGLRDVEHRPHPFWVSRYPAGRDATVAWPDVDLRFANTTPYGVLVTASVVPATQERRGAVQVSLWSTRVWDVTAQAGPRTAPTPPATRRLAGPSCVPTSGHDGFDIEVRRLFHRPGSPAVDHEDSTRTRYAPSDTVVCAR